MLRAGPGWQTKQFLSARKQFDPVAEWIPNMATLYAGDVFGFDDLDSMLPEPCDQCGVLTTTQCRMGLAGGPKILLYAYVHLD